MRLWVLSLVLIVLAAAPAYAAIESGSVVFSIQRDFSVEETIHLVFDGALNGTLDYALNEQVASVAVSDSNSALRYELIRSDSGYLLIIYPEGDTTLKISFVSKSLVFQNNDIQQFFTELSFAENVKKLDVKVVLPEGYGIYQNSYRPDGAEITSDGRNIELTWPFSNFNEPRIFSVKFEQLGKELNMWVLFSIILLGALAFGYRHHRKKSEESVQKTRQEFLTGFREDEKKVIEYMEKHKTAYQNKIEQEFKFSRAKMTRITQKLAGKGLLDKKKKGRTNRLTWIKKD